MDVHVCVSLALIYCCFSSFLDNNNNRRRRSSFGLFPQSIFCFPFVAYAVVVHSHTHITSQMYDIERFEHFFLYILLISSQDPEGQIAISILLACLLGVVVVVAGCCGCCQTSIFYFLSFDLNVRHHHCSLACLLYPKSVYNFAQKDCTRFADDDDDAEDDDDLDENNERREISPLESL